MKCPKCRTLNPESCHSMYCPMRKTHGGKRKGAGRPKKKESEKKEPTKVMRIPESKVDDVRKLIKV